MTTTLWIVVGVLGVFVAYTLVAPLALNVGRFLHRTWLFCPERKEHALVGVHALSSALRSAYGDPKLSVRTCSILKPGETCDANCLEKAAF
jgi:hypothetical protein